MLVYRTTEKLVELCEAEVAICASYESLLWYCDSDKDISVAILTDAGFEKPSRSFGLGRGTHFLEREDYVRRFLFRRHEGSIAQKFLTPNTQGWLI